ncbi:MAG TPA: ATP-binding protein [Vicinamibacterales bacterium]|nr:ATP-binding protein [Vicinamibacterales bacterium]
MASREQRAPANDFGEVHHLRSCIGNLISLQALPAIWDGREASRFLPVLLEALIGMLQLDFAYARAIDTLGGRTEMVRVPHRRQAAVDAERIGRALEPWVSGDEPLPSTTLPNPIGHGQLSISPLRFGIQGDTGVLVAGSQRPDFPTAIEVLLLRVAGNQATIALHEAGAAARQRQAAQELEQRIEERTRELRRTSEALRQAQADLAHVNRVTAMGQLAASITHEVTQPIAAGISDAYAALRWLGAQPPNLEEVRQSLARIVQEGNRAADIVGRIRAMFKKSPLRKDAVEINEAIREVVVLTHGELLKHNVVMQTQLAEDLPRIQGDRVQLQQVILNLIINAVEAMSILRDESRELLIGTRKDASGILVTVSDSGPGLSAESLERLFDAFYTTKAGGMGMGLSICRSIVEVHGGRIWGSRDFGPGATFQFTLPLPGA